MPRSAAALRLLAALALGLVAAGCAQAVPGLYPPNAVTAQGNATHDLYTIVFIIAAVIFFLVEGLILVAAIRFRRRPEQGDALPKQVHGHTGLELLWTGIPIAIVLFLFVASWQALNTVQARAADPSLKVTVNGFQWQWEFIYPDAANPKNNLTIIGLPSKPPELVVPAGETVEVTLKSTDVIHAFYVPQFLFKEDVVPGRTNIFDFKIDQPGTYRGQCAEFCGLQHNQMTFSVVAKTPAEFKAWLADARAKAQATPPPPASAAPGASGSAASGQTIQLAAQNVQFSQKDLTATADAPFSIAFDNKDAGVAHNVQIHQGAATGAVVFDGSLVTGVATTTYQVPALKPGAYTFVCKVHPTTMTGTLTVK